ncbi:MAG: metallophosphoesterase family protein [Saprospiraceae bacterium]|nr:metallophosphoesterase family protein [Saprospiraceae bacterium]
MINRFLILLLLFLMPCVSSGRTSRFRAMWRTDPATSMVIGWELVSGRQSRVIFQEDGGTQATWRVHFPDKMVSSKGMQNYFARIEGLQPDTRYRFVVRDSEGDSPMLYFHTAPGSPDIPITFIAGGDSRNNRSARKRLNKLAGQIQPLAILFSGDMTDMCSAHEWQEWLDDWQLTMTADQRLIPLVPARGNHETSNSVLEDIFDIPSPDAWYALGFGGTLIRVYTLNSLAPIHGRQTRWLADDLERMGGGFTWRIAQYHFPIRPHTRRKKERLDQQDAWGGLFHQHRVQLAQESDSHVAKITWPLKPGKGPGSEEGFVRDDAAGTVYIGEGSWGAPLRPADDAKSWTREIGSFHQFNWLCVRADEMEVRVIQADKCLAVQPLRSLSYGALPDGIACWAIGGSDHISLRPASDPMDEWVSEAERFPPIDLGARSSLQIPYRLSETSSVQVEFINSRREVIRHLSFKRDAGNYLEGVDVRDLPAGRYILTVRANDEVIMRRIVLQ